MNEELQDLAMEDLVRSTEHLYVAALRFVRAFERNDIDHRHDDDALPIGVARADLCTAAEESQSVYARAEASGIWSDEQ